MSVSDGESEDPERDAEYRRAQAQLGAKLFDRYRLEGVLGVGGLGVVYRALDERTGELVAVKRGRELVRRIKSASARFLREARIAQTLTHPSIPRGLDAELDDEGAPVLVMEYVAGKTLTEIVDEKGPLPVWDALAIGTRIAEALAVAHEAGVVHRDIKPDNVMLVHGAELPNAVCVLDFGLAYCLDEPRLSVAGTVSGSPEFMAPEQARGAAITPAADLYLLGATIAYALTGRPLYDGTVTELLMAHAMAPLPSLRAWREDLPKPVERYLVHLLAKNPVGRPLSAQDAAASLASLARQYYPGEEGEHDEPAQIDPEEAVSKAREALLVERHRAAEKAAAYEGKALQELADISARGIEREAYARRARTHADPRARSEAQARLAHLGDGAQDTAKEQALEQKLTELRTKARAERAEFDRRLRALG
jgi:serine/threonine protein kinase